MSAKRKNSRKQSGTVKIPLSFLIKIILFIAILVGIIFAIDYCSIKTNTNNSATEKVHEAKVQIVDFTREVLDEVLPPQETPKETATVSSPAEEKNDSKDSFSFPENLEIPLCAATKSGIASDHQIRRFENFTICYRENYEQAEWAAYCLEKEELVKNASRGNDFRPDPEITTGSASLADYKKSGYDRGHLAPAADFAFSEEAMSESFYLSNMSPQAPGLNREIWQYLEGQVRTWADLYGKVYVVTGPVLEKPAEEYESIGENKVSVPEYYYKVLISPDGDSAKGIGFILPNAKCPDTFWDYAVSIDEVERRTGLDFFYLMDNYLEDRLESSAALESWK